MAALGKALAVHVGGQGLPADSALCPYPGGSGRKMDTIPPHLGEPSSVGGSAG
jgi:hypothetical protein